jgi:transposase
MRGRPEGLPPAVPRHVEWTISIDSSSVRAHQHSTGARKKGAAPPDGSRTSPSTEKPSDDPAAGLTSKIHLAVDGRGLPMSIILTPGQSGDNPQLLPLLDQVAIRRDGPGRPRKRPEQVLADKAYSHPSTRAALRRRGIGFTSLEKTDQIARRAAKGSRGGRPPAFDPQLYAERNVVERCFNRLKQFRALATRYAKRVAYYRSEIILASIVLWLHAGLQDTP